LYDGSTEVLELAPEEIVELELAVEEASQLTAERKPARFTVVTKIRSQNYSPLSQRRMRPPYGITLHHTGGRFAGDIATLTKPARDPSRSVSANDYITKDGTIYELCEFPKRAWHAGATKWKGITDGNSHFWGIEIENRGTKADVYPKVQIDAVVWRCRKIRKKLNIDDASMLTRHRDICVPRGRKLDTSDNFPWASVRERVFAATDPTDSDGPAPPEPGRITLDSTLLAAPRIDVDRAYGFIVAKPNGEYTDQDVRTILDLYWDTCGKVGLDPLLVVTQMAHETGFLSSHWAARPRRNPAGIGVTGAPGAGISFPSWSKAVPAHAGRLLAYAIDKGKENDAQRELIAEALSWRSLPDSYRGAGRTLGGLTKRWATDPNYGTALAALANQMLGPT
jgi:N-acetyl-anhydromuramyl-L-alanine amidase AmpD